MIHPFPYTISGGIPRPDPSDGCATCHNGPNLTDERFHNLGLSREEKESLREFLATGLSGRMPEVRPPAIP